MLSNKCLSSYCYVERTTLQLIHKEIVHKKMGDPKTKFLRLFLSAVCPFVRPKKTFPDFALVGPPPWGQSYKVGSIL